MLWMLGLKNTKSSQENTSAFSLWFLNKLPTMAALMQWWCLNPESEFSDHLLWEVLSASRRADMYPQYMPATEHHLGEGDWVGWGQAWKEECGPCGKQSRGEAASVCGRDGRGCFILERCMMWGRGKKNDRENLFDDWIPGWQPQSSMTGATKAVDLRSAVN